MVVREKLERGWGERNRRGNPIHAPRDRLRSSTYIDRRQADDRQGDRQAMQAMTPNPDGNLFRHQMPEPAIDETLPFYLARFPYSSDYQPRNLSSAWVEVGNSSIIGLPTATMNEPWKIKGPLLPLPLLLHHLQLDLRIKSALSLSLSFCPSRTISHAKPPSRSIILEQHTDTLTVVDAADGLGSNISKTELS